jgi:hypothetical protein
MKEDKKKLNDYNYFDKIAQTCELNGWDVYVINNHSKIILMKTESNYYVLETSSNLNENPKIEQYSFENNKELYDFYYAFFEILKQSEVENGRSKRQTNRTAAINQDKASDKKGNHHA